uniref:Uncharacterized protein n=1 Tax=Populus alba TaxID=43335 RepID=A0A4V6ACA5_POPAL|nr:hypothetical protein D5086_0000009470 [Populus alba]
MSRRIELVERGFFPKKYDLVSLRKGLSLVSSSTTIGGGQNALLHTSSMPPLQPALNSIQDVNTIASSEENAQPSMITTANVPASFEFHVSSEEGIKLCVDLNSSPSEWIKKYKNQVSLCDNVVNTKSRSLYQELGCIGESNKKMKSSVLQNMDSDQIRDDSVQTDPSPSSVAGKNTSVSNGHPVGGNNSLISSPIIPCGVVVDVTQSLEADPVLASAEPSSDGQNQKLRTLNPVVKGEHRSP